MGKIVEIYRPQKAVEITNNPQTLGSPVSVVISKTYNIGVRIAEFRIQ